MTKKERAQVVELLKCAASPARGGFGVVGMFEAAKELGYASRARVNDIAWEVRNEVCTELECDPAPANDSYTWQLLEAAARVEEGSWSPTRTGGRR